MYRVFDFDICDLQVNTYLNEIQLLIDSLNGVSEDYSSQDITV